MRNGRTGRGRTMVGVVAGCAAISGLAGFGAPAGAEEPASPPATVPVGQVVLTAAGADATLEVSGAIVTGTNNYNIPTLPQTPFAVPGDANCPDLEYVIATPGPNQVIAPISAGTGLNMLKAQSTNPVGQRGCLDIARSSSSPRGLAQDNATFEYYAFALDSASWATTSLLAPATITKQQLKDIYNCTITDWSELPGGGSGPIQRYFTQVGSGMGAFFQSDLLDGQDPLAVSSADCPAAKRRQQSDASLIDPGDIQKAILPYATSNFIFQANNRTNPTLDKRNGARLGGITVPGPSEVRGLPVEWNGLDAVWQQNTSPGGVVTEGNAKVNTPVPAFPGIKYVYHTIDSISPSYAEAAGLVGFNNVPAGAKSVLCTGGRNSALLSYGFGPLTTASPPGNGAGSNLAGSTCRKYTN